MTIVSVDVEGGRHTPLSPSSQRAATNRAALHRIAPPRISRRYYHTIKDCRLASLVIMSSRVQGIVMDIFQRPPAAVAGMGRLRNTRGAANTNSNDNNNNNSARQGAGVAATGGGEGSSAAEAAGVAAPAGGGGGAGARTRAVVVVGGAETGAAATAPAAAAAARDTRNSNSPAVPQQLPPPLRPPPPPPPPRVGIRGASARRMTTNTRMYPVGPRPQGNDFLLFSLGFAAVVSFI